MYPRSNAAFFSKPLTGKSINIAKIPKVELHAHLEAAMKGAFLQTLAREHNIPLPQTLLNNEGAINWKAGDFADFLTKYTHAADMICKKEAITDLTYHYLAVLHAEGAIYAEPTIWTDHFAKFGITYQEVIDAVASGIDKANAEFDIEARMIIVLVRHLGVEACEKVAETIIANPHPYVVGVGLAGNEADFPPVLFEAAYNKLRQAGLQLTAHAGEWTSHEDVLNAIKHLKVSRIGHGIHAAFDKTTMAVIKENNIHLEVCPGSNHSLETHNRYPAHHKHIKHPLQILHHAGVSYSLSTDDRLFFQNTMVTEYQYTKDLLNLSNAELLQITLNGINASFAPEALKQKLRNNVYDFASVNGIDFVPENKFELKIT